MKKILAGLVLSGFALALIASGNDAGDKKSEKPKYTISQVMKKAMKGGLCGKVAGGKASAAEKKELVALFTALEANTPPKGDADSWKAKSGALKAAAEAVLAGEKGAGALLKKAADCKGCHGAHK